MGQNVARTDRSPNPEAVDTVEVRVSLLSSRSPSTALFISFPTNLKTALLAAVSALTIVADLHAQDVAKLYRYSPLVLLTPAGTRTLAMGGTGIAGRDDDVLFYNPAMLVLARGFSASVQRYSPWSTGGSISSVTRFNTGGIAIGARMVDYRTGLTRFETTRAAQLHDGVAGGSSVEGSVGIGQVLKGFRLGGAVKYSENTTPVIRAGAVGVDLGIARDFFGPYTFGLSVQNIGQSMQVPCSIATTTGTPGDCTPSPDPNTDPSLQKTTTQQPFRVTLGAQTQRILGEFDFVGTAAVFTLRSGWLGATGGAELGYGWLEGYSVALRAGARRPLPGESAMTAGAGFNMDRLSIDYAVEALAGSRFGHRFGLRVR